MCRLFCLFPAVSAQLTLKMCVAAQNHKKITKSHILGFKVIQRSSTYHLDPPICRDTGGTATEALKLAKDKPFGRTIATAGRFG